MFLNPGMMLSRVGGSFAPVNSYTGPGDVVSGAFAWYGLRGYTAAYSTGSNPALDLVDQAGANPLTVNILSNGRLDVASINTWVTANSVSTIKVKKAYDQTGNARHMNQATLANMPVLNLTGFGSLPAIQVTAASSHSMSTGALTLAQPSQTWSVVGRRNSSGATTREMMAFGGTMQLFSEQNVIKLAAGTTTAGITAADATWHAIQAIYSTTASAAYVDGSATTGLSVGSGSPSSAGLQMGSPGVSNFFDGSYAEWGVWGSAFNGTQAGNMNTNQHGANGHNF